ncbi:hypothetical protein NDA01_07700 [Trichocoleus desertorum AS-A10]
MSDNRIKANKSKRFLSVLVEALQLNREGLFDLRRILHTTGEHPPLETAN